MTEENIVHELKVNFENTSKPEVPEIPEELKEELKEILGKSSPKSTEETEIPVRSSDFVPGSENLVTLNSTDDEPAETLKTEDDDIAAETLSDDDINFIQKFYDEDGEQIEIRENKVGNHKVASSPIVFEDILPDYIIDLLAKRVADIDEDDWEPGQIGNDDEGGQYPDSRECEISWIEEIDWVCTIFTHYFHIANREIFEYDLTEMESLQVTKYDKSHFYGWHSDYGTSGNKDLTRKLSMSIVLSDPEEYSGGKLQFIDYQGKVQNATKAKGSIIVFDSRTPHRVTPILRGQRLSLVSWMTGPKLR